MKRIFVISAVLIGLFLFGVPVSFATPSFDLPFLSYSQAELSENTITVAGTGLVERASDSALLSFSIQSKAKTAKESLSQNKQKIEKIRDSLLSTGTVGSDIKVSRFSISSSSYPTYDYDYDSIGGKGGDLQSATGFTASQGLIVTLKRGEDIPGALDAMVTNGATAIDSVSIDTRTVSLRVEVTDSQAKLAMTTMQGKVDKIKQALISFGVVPKRDVRLAAYLLHPSYSASRSTTRTEKKEFTTNHALTVDVKNIDKIDQVIDAAVASGAESAPSMTMKTSENTKTLHKKAREAAMADAREKAAELASMAGLKLGRIKAINASNVITLDNIRNLDYLYSSSEKDTIRVESNIIVQFETSPKK